MKNNNPAAFLSVIYAEDLRQEVDNKISLIGIFGGVIPVSGDPPYILPKLGIFATFRLPAFQVPVEITAKLKLDEEVLLEGAPMTARAVVANAKRAAEATAVDITLSLVANNVELKALGTVRVEFLVGDQLYGDQLGRRLALVQPPAPETGPTVLNA